MPTVITSAGTAGDWLKREADSLFSRDQGTLAAGAGNLKSGRVLGKITASGKLTGHTAGATDGSQTATSVLLYDADATAGDVTVVTIARDAIVMHQGLTQGPDVDTAAKRATVAAALAAKLIIDREGA